MRVLKLNASYELLSIEHWQECMHLVVDERAYVAEVYEGKYIHSVNQKWALPAVIVMKQYVNQKKRRRSFAPSTRNVLIRDNFICQYCGCKLTQKNGTKDHVVPFSKGGPTTMKNLVASCKECNAKKDDRTCKESGMYPLSQARDMSDEEKLKSILKTFKTVEKKVWFKYLNENGLKLW